MSARLTLDFSLRRRASSASARRDRLPFRILVLADLGARDHRAVCEPGDGLAGRPVLRLEAHELDDALARLAPELRLALPDRPDAGLAVSPRELDDLHPDHLYATVDAFRALRETRARLLDPATFAETARALGTPTSAPAPPAAPAPADDDALFTRILGRPARPDPAAPDVGRLLRAIVAPHVVPAADPAQAPLVASVEAAATDLMRTVLHHPDFRALESAWRSLRWLLGELETGEDLEVHVLDVGRHELAVDLEAAGPTLERSGLHRRLVTEGAGAMPWSVVVGDFSFGPEPADVARLAALGAIASRAGGPFLAAADPRTLGVASLAEAPDPDQWPGPSGDAATSWAALRACAAAPAIGLALPRLLLRLPYGARTDALEALPFEEVAEPVAHEAYLWGNPAFACAMLLGRAFQDAGWAMAPGAHQDVADLPAHVRTVAGAPRLQPCAEVVLSERGADALLARGLMPFVSHRDRNAARLVRFQSVADPAAPLAGPWQ